MNFKRAILASLAVVAATGCSVDTDDPGFDTLDQGLVCQSDEGWQQMAAALAVAVGREMHRWDYRDFQQMVKINRVCNPWTCWNDYKTVLGLTSAGEARCAADPTNCRGVRAILDMQTADPTFQQNQPHAFWPDTFATKLVAGSQAAIAASKRAPTDVNHCYALSHTLGLPSAAEANGCGELDFRFTVSGVNPAELKCQMLLYTGGGDVPQIDYNNPWIHFRVDSSDAIIDPNDSTVVDSTAPTLNCWDAATGYVYDNPKTKLGQCCMLNGVQKKLTFYNTNWDRCNG
jgi:hypothetical protein